MSDNLRIYFAAPFFSTAERVYNARVIDLLEERWSVFYPYRDGIRLADLIARGEEPKSAARQVWECDVAEITRSDAIVAILDGRVPDEGVCVELGFARGLGKFVVGLSTDMRGCFSWGDNPMLTCCLDFHCRSQRDMLTVLSKRAVDERCPSYAGAGRR